MPEAEEAGSHEEAVTREFERAAHSFARRTHGRFDHLNVVDFARVRPAATVAEVGAGTGNFLRLFAAAAERLVALDLTPGMLHEARRHADMLLVAADGKHLPLTSRSVDLVASAQVLHHVLEPLSFLNEMRRVCAADGKVLIVDQVATERFEEAVAMTELERLRDPTHAASRPVSALRILLASAGLDVVDERLVESGQRFSDWMWAEEFPRARIDAVRDFIERRGVETGLEFERDGDDWVFVRRRVMLLAERA
ncbi:MAG: class I SAM-dependent methyltransferase [Actinomycetota bacterium]